ncbi:MAG: CHRD domain-containing protein [Hymenobacteraceae bacterium]|nr:CHRD domain-containing protein [Hymenobacteraceae bacterium]
MLKRFPFFLMLLVGLAVASCKDDEDKPPVTPAPDTVSFVATISGSQQVPLNASTATGAFTGTYDRTSKTLTYNVTFSGLTPTSGHIHLGGPGRTGGFKVPFNSLTSPITGSQVLDQQTADSLLAGRTYVNLHTTAFSGGEIRGNIQQGTTAPVPPVEFAALLTGGQQVPANGSRAGGALVAAYYPATRLLTYNVTFSGLTPTSGHIHLGGPGRTGGFKVPFNSLTSPITGSQVLDQQTADSLLAGRTYVNLHTAAFPGGEIRGNIRERRLGITLGASINSAQQVQPNASAATGTFTGTYDRTTSLLTYSVTYTGLTPMAGHIHLGGPGRTGGFKVPFNSLTSPITGSQVLDQQTADSLLTDRTYVNLHTTTFPGGEIRGDIKVK